MVAASPELISTQIYAGPGASSLYAAAAAWQKIATELYGSAQSVSQLVSGLTGYWSGAASTQMQQATNEYTAWLTQLSNYASRTGQSARSAAAAYEQIRASVVPPTQFVQNRALFTQVVALPDMFGTHAPLIATLESQYAQMAAQNVSASAAYATQAHAATASLPQTPVAPQTLATSLAASPSAAPGVGGVLDSLNGLLGGGDYGLNSQFLNTFASAFSPTGIVQDVTSFGFLTAFIGSQAAQAAADDRLHDLVLNQPPGESAGGSSATVKPAEITARGGGAAPPIGRLSVPPSWTTEGPQMGRATGSLAAPARTPIGFPTVPFVPVAGMPGTGTGSSVRGRGAPRPREDPEYGDPQVVMPRHPMGG